MSYSAKRLQTHAHQSAATTEKESSEKAPESEHKEDEGVTTECVTEEASTT